jgi:hypothetical protein
MDEHCQGTAANRAPLAGQGFAERAMSSTDNNKSLHLCTGASTDQLIRWYDCLHSCLSLLLAPFMLLWMLLICRWRKEMRNMRDEMYRDSFKPAIMVDWHWFR